MRRRSERAASRAVQLFGLAALGLAVLIGGRAADTGDAPSRLEVALEPHGMVRWDRGQTPVLLVTPLRGDGWITLSRRYCGTSEAVAAIRDANPALRQPMRDRTVAIPVATLRSDLRLEVVRGLFPADRRVADGWLHWVVDPFGGGEESWQWLAELFAGSGEAVTRIRASNPTQPEEGPRRGGQLVVPTALLLDVFRQLEPLATPTPAPRPSSTAATTVIEAGPLSYGADERGPFALYRLQKGEALYSAVVVRFTGQVYAKQVNTTAVEIARRSGIEDVTDIPIGYPIKIPLDLLLPKFLPPDHPRRLEWEEERRELAAFLEVVQATDLTGVHVIIDAGHGGADTGAIVDGLWEASYVYDIACRIKANLERHTRAEVWVTRQDSKRGFAVPDQDLLPQHREHVLLTRPSYPLEDSVLGVHLRWYLANDIILNRLGPKVPRSKTVFLSVHADSLHPSVRGAMVYVPSRYLRPSKYTVQRRDIQKYQEYRNHPTVRLGSEFKARVEASSRHLAENLIATLEDNEIMVHPDEPVRDRVLRGRRSWVPAVLRYSAAQNAVLVECCNMSNDDDRALLVNRRWREQFARAVVEGTASAFSGR